MRKTIKTLVSLVLVVTFILSMSVSAFAASERPVTTFQSITVKPVNFNNQYNPKDVVVFTDFTPAYEYFENYYVYMPMSLWNRSDISYFQVEVVFNVANADRYAASNVGYPQTYYSVTPYSTKTFTYKWDHRDWEHNNYAYYFRMIKSNGALSDARCLGFQIDCA